MKKQLSIYLGAGLLVCCCALAFWSPALKADVETTAEEAAVPSLFEAATPSTTDDPGSVEVEPFPVPLTCNDQSHDSCKGKLNGAACVLNGRTGTCVASYPSSECLCIT
jgi:hypothetical protein